MRFHARARRSYWKTNHGRFLTTVSGDMKTSTATVRQERCSARFLLQKEKEVVAWSRVSFPGPDAVGFSSFADSQGSNSTEEARDMADHYINVITGRFIYLIKTLKITKPQNVP